MARHKRVWLFFVFLQLRDNLSGEKTQSYHTENKKDIKLISREREKMK